MDIGDVLALPPYELLEAIGRKRGLLVRGRSTLAIDTSKVECDYYTLLRGDRSTISSYRGEYMTQYSWAEVTRSALRQQAAASQKGGLPSYYAPPTGF